MEEPRVPARGAGFEERSSPSIFFFTALNVSFEISLESLEDSLAEDRARLVALVLAIGIEAVLELLEREDVGQVPLVVLEDQGQVLELDPDLREVGAEIDHALDVGVLHGALRVAHEDDAVHPLQDQLARGVVEDLSRDGVELDPRLEAPDDADVQGEEVEEQRAVRLGFQRDHLPARAGRGPAVDVMEVRRFSTQTGAVINDLGRHLHGGVVEKHHDLIKAPEKGRCGILPLLPASESSNRRRSHHGSRPSTRVKNLLFLSPAPACASTSPPRAGHRAAAASGSTEPAPAGALSRSRRPGGRSGR